MVNFQTMRMGRTLPSANGSPRAGDIRRLRIRFWYSFWRSAIVGLLCSAIGSTFSPSWAMSLKTDFGAVKDGLAKVWLEKSSSS